MPSAEMIYREAKTLPPDIVDEVFDFIGFLKARHEASHPLSPLSHEEFAEGVKPCPLSHSPNAETVAALMEDTTNAKRYTSSEEFWTDLMADVAEDDE